jgi:O-antigen/teichoic acid export membrane protein
VSSRNAGGPRLTHNSLVALSGRLGAIAFSLLLAFGLFRALGADRYGAWSLLAAILTAVTVVDFGLPAAVEREVAAHRAAGRSQAAGRVIVAGVAIVALVAAIGQITVLLLPVTPGPVWAEAWDGARLLPTAFSLGLAGLVVGAGLTGIQRFAAFHACRTAGLAVGTVGTVTMAFLGVTRLDALVAIYALGSVVSLAACVVALRRAWRELPLGRTDGASIGGLLHFGGALQAASLAPMLADYVFRVLVGGWFGPASAGLYDLAARVSIGLRSLSGALVSALVPHAVGLFATTATAEIESLHRRAVAVVAFLMLPATAAGIFIAPRLAHLVTSDGGAATTLAAAIVGMLTAHLVAAIVAPGLLMARAARRPWPEAAASAIGAVFGLAVAAIGPTMPVAAAGLWAVQSGAHAAAWLWLARTLPFRGLASRAVWAVAAAAAMSLVLASGLDYLLDATRRPPTGGFVGLVALCATFASAAIAADLIPPEIGRHVPQLRRRT